MKHPCYWSGAQTYTCIVVTAFQTLSKSLSSSDNCLLSIILVELQIVENNELAIIFSLHFLLMLMEIGFKQRFQFYLTNLNNILILINIELNYLALKHRVTNATFTLYLN